MENVKRSVFALNGVTGMLIATALLLAILACLTCLGIKTQQAVMDKPYELKDISSVSEKSSVDTQKKVFVIKCLITIFYYNM